LISSRKANNICVVLPIFNEVEHLDKLIPEVHRYADQIICVDDGSTDGSLEKLKKYDDIKLISFEKNMGKGKALYFGLSESIKSGSDITITLDADGQHDPSFITEFISKNSFCDFVIGNRMNDVKKMPLQRIVSNKITSWLLTKKLGVRIVDSQSGFRSFSTSKLKNILPSSSGFEAETEMIIKAAKLNYNIDNVDIPTIYNENKSKIKPIKTIIGFIKVYSLY